MGARARDLARLLVYLKRARGDLLDRQFRRRQFGLGFGPTAGTVRGWPSAVAVGDTPLTRPSITGCTATMRAAVKPVQLCGETMDLHDAPDELVPKTVG